MEVRSPLRRCCRLALALLLVAVAVVPARAGDEPADPPLPGADAEAAPLALAYAGPDDVEATLRELASQAGSARARVEVYGRSTAGRSLVALHLGAPGRPSVLVHGGLGAHDAAGTVAVLELARRLVADAASDFDGLSWVLVPAPHPDALLAWPAGGVLPGREDQRPDRDRDGRLGEDGPRDIDGDGLVLWMRVPRPDGAWRVRAPEPDDKRRDKAPDDAVTGDPRWMVEDADARTAVRYDLLREGLDDDGDGEVNEDPPALDMTRQMCGTFDGVQPWSGDGAFPGRAPETRALMDLSLATPALIAWYGFTSSGTHLLRANERGDAADVDKAAYERLLEDLEDATGLKGRRAGGDNPGSDLDWASVHLGVLAVRVPVARVERSAKDARPGDDVDELDWLLWNDEQLGGQGFRAWTPFEHPTLGVVEIGGWLPGTRHEPPEDRLGAAVARVCEAPRRHAKHVPRLAAELEVKNAGAGLVELVVHVANRGDADLETRAARDARVARPVHVRLVTEDGVERLGGPPAATLPACEQGAREGPLRWLLRVGDAASGTRVARLLVHHRIGGDLEEEVRVP
ncbi:MAG: M14 family zinc carboxypeptidase [Planctomycetota bacterium]